MQSCKLQCCHIKSIKPRVRFLFFSNQIRYYFFQMISILEFLMSPLCDSYKSIQLHAIPSQRHEILEILKAKAFTKTRANFLLPQYNHSAKKIRVASGPRVKLASCKMALTPTPPSPPPPRHTPRWLARRGSTTGFHSLWHTIELAISTRLCLL